MPTHLESYRPLLPALAAAGEDPRPLLASLGVDPDAEVGTGKPPEAIAMALLRHGMREHGEGFAVDAGGALSLSELGVYGYACITAPDIRTAIDRALRYRRLVFGNDDYSWVPEAGGMALVRRPPPGDPDALEVRGLVELGFSQHVSALRELLDGQLPPLTLELAHDPPGDRSSHRRVFGREPIFGAHRHALHLPEALLDWSTRHGHPGLASYFEERAEAALAKAPRKAPYTRRVESMLARGMTDGAPTMAEVARRLGLSARTLARRLASEGTRYQDLLDGVRRELALDHLAHTELGLAEIAYLLGFSEPSAFSRAVKRWTGRTPAAVRRRSRSKGGP